MFEWISTNWNGIALCCFVLSTIISEVMAFTKNPANGIIDAIAKGLSKLSGRD
jgi:uncharacterized membrane protein